MAERVEKCTADPNFAVICSFLERFAKPCGISHPNFLELQEMLENCEIVPQPLVDLHVKLLRKARKSVSIDRWERAVVKFCHMYAGSEFQQDGWEMEQLGYKNLRLDGKLRVLKLLLEHQFDLNTKFKGEVNRLSSSELRLQPFGRDKVGQNYWLQQDEFCNLKVYREDADNETWQVVAGDRESLVQLITELSGGNLDSVFNSDDSNSQEGAEGLDTGQAKGDNSSSKPDKIKSDNVANGGVPESDHRLETNEEKPPTSIIKEEPLTNSERQDSKSKTHIKSECHAETAPSRSEQKSEKEVKEMLKENRTETNETEKAHDKRPAEAPSEEREAKRVKVEGVEVSEAIEEKTLIVAGEGSGKECNDGNDILSNSDNLDVGEAIEEPVMYFSGDGSGHECNMGNPTNSDETEKSGSTSGDNAKVVTKTSEGESLPSTNGTIETESKKTDDDELDFLKTGFYFGPGTLAAKDRIPMGSPEPKIPGNQGPESVEGEKRLETIADCGNSSISTNAPQKIATSHDAENVTVDAAIAGNSLENVNVSNESGIKETQSVSELEQVPSAGCLDIQGSVDPSVSTSQIKDSCSQNDVESLKVSETIAHEEPGPNKILDSSMEIKPDADVKGSDSVLPLETAESACVDVNKVESSEISSQIEEVDTKHASVCIEPVSSQTSCSSPLSPLKVTTNVEIMDKEEAADEKMPVSTTDKSLDSSLIQTENPTPLGNDPFVKEDQSKPAAAEDSSEQSKMNPAIDYLECQKSVTVKESNALDKIDNGGALKIFSSKETVSSIDDSKVEEMNKDVASDPILISDQTVIPDNIKSELARPNEGSDLVSSVDNVSDFKAKSSAGGADPLPDAVKAACEEAVPPSTCSNLDETKELFNFSETEDKMCVPENDSTETPNPGSSDVQKCSEGKVEEIRDDVKRKEFQLDETERKSPSVPTSAVAAKAESCPLVEPHVTALAGADSQAVVPPIPSSSVTESQPVVPPVISSSKVEPQPPGKLPIPVSTEADSKMEEVPTAATAGKESFESTEADSKMEDVPTVATVGKKSSESIEADSKMEEVPTVATVEKESSESTEADSKMEEVPAGATVGKESSESTEADSRMEDVPTVGTVGKESSESTVADSKIEDVPTVGTVGKESSESTEADSKIEDVPTLVSVREELSESAEAVCKTEDLPVVATVGEDSLKSHEDHPSVLDDDPPAITTLEDAMRQMEAAGAPVHLEDSDDDDHSDAAGDAHEEEEEEKSFFVFEGSTGGWKHATTGQMEDEQTDKEVLPERAQTTVEPSVSEANSSKKSTQSSIKERLKIIPRRGTRSTRHSDPLENAGGDEVADKDTLAAPVDESADKSSSRGTKRRSNDGEEGSDNADSDDDVKRARTRGKLFADRAPTEERAGQGDGSSGDEAGADADAEAEAEDVVPDQGDVEGESGQAPRRGGWRGRRGRGRWRGRGRGRGGRAGAAPAAASASAGQDNAEAEAEGGDTADKSDTSSVPATPEKSPRKPKKSRMLAELEVDLDMSKVDEPEESGRAVRTSRRIAQIRLKEQADKRDYEEAELTLKERLKMEKDAKRAAKLEKKRLAQEKATAVASDSDDDRKKKKKKKSKEKKPNFNPDRNVWNQTSSGSSSGSESVEEEIPEPSDEDAPFIVKSDHEFSPESDVNDDDDDYQPTRRARTARRDKGAEAEVEPEPQDYPCKKCAKSDHPEWMLLCDKCDAGWHCSCLRPALLQIPEGDWFCPPCQHTLLIASLQQHLQSYDENMKRLASEEARKKFMSFVEVNAENILPDEEGEMVKKRKKKKKLKIKHRERVRGKRRRCQIIDSDKDDDDGDSGSDGSENDVDNDDKNDPDAEDESNSDSGSADTTSSGTPTSSSSSSSSSSASEKSSDEDEPIYQLRQRRQTNVNYRFSEYDDLIKSAIQDGIEDEAPVAEETTATEAPIEGVEPAIPEKTVKSVGKVLEGEEDEQEESSDEDVKKKPQRRGKYLTDEEEEDEPEAKDEDDDDEEEEEEDEDEEEEGYVPPVVKSTAKIAKAKKKKRSLTALEFSSTSSDPESDEDFNGSSAADDDEEEASGGSDSDDSIALSRRRRGPARRSGRYSNKMTKWDRAFIDDSTSMDSDDSDAPRKKKKKKSAPKPRKPPPKRAPPKGRPKKKARKSDDSDKEVKIKKAKPKAAPKREQSGSDSDAPAPRRTRGRKMDYREVLASSEEEGSGDKKTDKKDKKGKGKFAELGKGKKAVESPDSAEAVTVSQDKPRTHPRVKVTPLRNAAAGAAATATSDAAAAPVVGVPTATIVAPAGVTLPPSSAVSITPSVASEKSPASLQPSVTITPSNKKNSSVPAPPTQMKTPSHIVAPGIPPSITAVPINPETKVPVGLGQTPRTLKELQQLVSKTPEASVSPAPQGAPGASAAAGTPAALQAGSPHAAPQSQSATMPIMPSGPAPPTTYASSASGPLMAMQALAGEAPPPAYPYPQQYYHQPPPGHHSGPPPHAPYLPTPHPTSHLTQPTASPHLQGMAPHHGAHHPHHPHLGPPGPAQHHQSASQSHHQPPHHPTPTHHASQSHHAAAAAAAVAAAAAASHHHHHLMQGHHVGAPHLSPHHPHLAVPPHHQPHPMLPHHPYGPPPGAPHAALAPQMQALTQLPPQVPSPGNQPPPKYEEERRSEFGGLVSYFSSQHDDMEG